MEKQDYMPRIIDKKIEYHLKAFGAVCIEGPKWCGKTWTSSFHCRSAVYMGDPSGNFHNRKLAEMVPSLVLEGEKPRLIDEWQEVPQLWDAVRYEVDRTNGKGQYILTGSATPDHKGILHSEAGRISKIHMRPMSLFESGDSSGVVSLEKLCRNEFSPVFTGDVELMKLIKLIIRGGWPASISVPDEMAALLPEEYLKAVVDDDVHRIDGRQRNRGKMWLLLKSLARNESTVVSNRTLRKDIKDVDDEDIDVETVKEYLDIFARLFITDDQPPFDVNARSSVRVKQAVKHHFSDPSLASALLKATPLSLLGDLETLGNLFEALCERDLKIYAESFGGKLYHYQDYLGKEIDAVIEMPDGSWGAFEIKLGANSIDDAADNLISIKKAFEKDPKGRPPALLCVISGMSNAAYQRPDGVYVVPITALRN